MKGRIVLGTNQKGEYEITAVEVNGETTYEKGTS